MSYVQGLDRRDDIRIAVFDRAGTFQGEIPGAAINNAEWILNEAGTAEMDGSAFDSVLADKLILMQREVQIVWQDVDDAENPGHPVVWQGISSGDRARPGLLTLQFEELLAWLKKRPVETGSLTYNTVDQFDIGWGLITTAQTGTNHDLRFTASYSASGKTRSRLYERDQHKIIYDALLEFSTLKLLNGFDYEIKVDDAGLRQWVPYYPQKGSFKGNCRLEYPGNIVNYERTRDGMSENTKIYAKGASTNGVLYEQNYEDTAASALTGALVAVVNYPGEKDVNWLLDKAQQNVVLQKAPKTIWTMTVHDTPGKPLFGQIKTGDTVQVIIDDGATQLNDVLRIRSIKWNNNGSLDLGFVNPTVL